MYRVSKDNFLRCLLPYFESSKKVQLACFCIKPVDWSHFNIFVQIFLLQKSLVNVLYHVMARDPQAADLLTVPCKLQHSHPNKGLFIIGEVTFNVEAQKSWSLLMVLSLFQGLRPDKRQVVAPNQPKGGCVLTPMLEEKEKLQERVCLMLEIQFPVPHH